MELKPTEKHLLSVASKLPVLGFWQGFWIAFSRYFMRKLYHRFNYKFLLLNQKPHWTSVSNYRIQRYLNHIKSLVNGRYLSTISQSLLNDKTVNCNSLFKITDKGWRAAGDLEIQERISRNHHYTSTPHDLLVSAVLLTYHYFLDFQLSRPSKWRRLANNQKCPLPDGVVESPFGEIWAVEVERTFNRKRLERHIIYHGRNSKVIVIFKDYGTLRNVKMGHSLQDLIRKYGVKNWLFTIDSGFFKNNGRGLYLNPYEEFNYSNRYTFDENGRVVFKPKKVVAMMPATSESGRQDERVKSVLLPEQVGKRIEILQLPSSHPYHSLPAQAPLSF